MAPFNFDLLKDELSLSAWLAIGATAQVIFSQFAPREYAYVPAALTFLILTTDLVLQLLSIRRYSYLKSAVMDRHSVLFPDADGSKPDSMGDKPVAMFLVGIRSNHPFGRLLPAYRKLNDYLDKIYEDAEKNRTSNGYLGRTPDWLPNEFSQNNTLCSISYWKSIEDLEAFARQPVHLQGLKFLASTLLGEKGHDVGVIHEVLVCPAGHWEAIYGNINPWGFGGTLHTSPKNKGLQPPIIERNPKVLNGMWGRMGDLRKQEVVDKKLAVLMGGGLQH